MTEKETIVSVKLSVTQLAAVLSALVGVCCSYAKDEDKDDNTLGGIKVAVDTLYSIARQFPNDWGNGLIKTIRECVEALDCDTSELFSEEL